MTLQKSKNHKFLFYLKMKPHNHEDLFCLQVFKSCYNMCNIFSQIWSKEAQGYKSNILLLLYQYVFIDAYFRKSIIEIWEINPRWTNSSINGSRKLAFTEIVGYFCNIGAKIRKMCCEIWLLILLELSIDLHQSYNS